MDIRNFIRDVPDFPKPGVIFKDITPLLRDSAAFAAAIEQLADHYRSAQIDAVAGVESRGFIFGAALARALNKGFIPIRKPGKLPWKTRNREYSLEYGTDCVEIHEDAVKPGEKVVLVDDLLATGGTARACAELLREIGADLVGVGFVIELGFLNGAQKLGNEKVFSLLKY